MTNFAKLPTWADKQHVFADAIKVHHGVTGTRDDVHAATIALDETPQT